jgi:peptidoglycan-associated lipoprotein
MRGKVWLRVAVCGVMSVALCSGCGIFGKKKDKLHPMGPETLPSIEEPTGGPGALPERTADGVPVNEFKDKAAMVLFAYDSYQIAETEVSKVEAVAKYMKSNADVKLVAEGHCDERGSNEYNMSLGEHRALAVRAYLVGLGVDGARIQTRSFGEEKPLNPGHGEAAWHENRRVEFSLFR